MALLNEVENYLLHLRGSWCRKRDRERVLRLLKGRGCNGSVFEVLIQLGGHFTNTPRGRGISERQKGTAKIFLAELKVQRQSLPPGKA